MHFRAMTLRSQITLFLLKLDIFWVLLQVTGIDSAEVIYAVNAGGEAHTDSSGIHYMRDHAQVGVASDFGKQWVIGRVPEADQILYQTERYNHHTFGYDIPIPGDGEYVLVLKFAEVYFNEPRRKVSNF
ncbi:unnamed protein product [Cyprideis torosa]|uniref:Uncharacterized protein n=1 Tax=Cyprideis torosa TaxID=163714 RepID=A0A7R8WE97_9CRUS|nr:unnamed protein product [Cyprideis torosa]CAG0892616.1 unnamed protein product [Cyprideis torosa]